MKDKTGYRVKSSYILQLNGLDDKEIYVLAKTQGKVIIISKDSDFPELINLYGAPPKLINIRIGNTDNKFLFGFILKNLEQALQKLIFENINIVDLEI